MTRDDICKAYEVDENGRIKSPGKFEGEMVWAPYFYYAWLNGEFEDSDSDGEYQAEILPEDIALFPELSGMTMVTISESDQGFVFCRCLS